MTSVGLAASGVGLLSTIIAAPVTLDLQAGRSCVYSESKLNTIADRISVALNDDKITEEEVRLILSEIDKNNQMKTKIRGRQKQSLSEDEKKHTISACERQSDDDSPRQVVERNLSWNQQWHLSISCWRA